MSKHNKSEKRKASHMLSWDLWVASFLADIAPKGDGEEWIGDLKEARFKLVQDGKSNWYVVIITLLRTCLLALTFVRIKYQDLRLSESASSPTDLQRALDTITENAARLCEAPRAAIHRVDGNILRRVAVLEEVPRSPIGEQIPIYRDRLPCRAVVDRKTIHFIDRNVPPDMKLSADTPKGVGRWGAKAGIATPLLRKGKEVIGCLVVSWDEYRTFTDEQLASFETVASQAAIAIENLRLFRGDKARRCSKAFSSAHQRSLRLLAVLIAVLAFRRVRTIITGARRYG
jgi:transcriptional regulator with GAF, ATPase, and Fis domain